MLLVSAAHQIKFTQSHIYCSVLLFSEPGYYEANSFGLRHENINVVVEAKTKVCLILQYSLLIYLSKTLIYMIFTFVFLLLFFFNVAIYHIFNITLLAVQKFDLTDTLSEVFL